MPKCCSLQDHDGAKHPRLSSGVLDMEAAHKWPRPLPREQRGTKHVSIERNASDERGSPESSANSLHITLRGAFRAGVLRLLNIFCKSPSEGRTYALGLAEILRWSDDVLPARYHEGVHVGK